MKRLTAVLVLLMVFLAAIAFGQQEPAKEKAPKPGMGMMRGQGGPGAMMGLKLTDEQKAKIQDLRLAHQKEILPLRTEIQKLQSNLKLEITAEKLNEGKVKSIQSELSKLTNEIGSKTILHQRAVRDLLTPEQKKQFDSRILSGGMMGGAGPMKGGMMKGGMRGQGRMMRPGMMMRHGGQMGPGGPMGMHRGVQCTGECKCGAMN